MIFHILITKDSQQITSLYSPDFDAQLLDSTHLETTIALDEYVAGKLQGLFEDSGRLIKPKSSEQLQQFRLVEPQQSWAIFYINLPQASACEKYLPILGNLANISTILTSADITYMALRIASSKNGVDNSSSIPISILATTVSTLLGLVLYRYSDAGHSLTYAGRNINNTLSGLFSCRYEKISLNHIKVDWSLHRIIALFTIAIIASNSAISSIKIYQESKLLTDKFLDLDNNQTSEEREFKKELITWLVINNFIFSSVFSSLAFQAAFLKKFVDDAAKKIDIRQKCSGLFFRYFSASSHNASAEQTVSLMTTDEEDTLITTAHDEPNLRRTI